MVPAAMLGVLMLRAIWDVDIFWQLKLGEMILAKGGPIRGLFNIVRKKEDSEMMRLFYC